MISPVSEEQFSKVSPESSNHCNHLPLIHDETVKYTRRMEEGCDITTDSQYNYWLLSQPIASIPETQHSSKHKHRSVHSVLQPQRNTLLTKVLSNLLNIQRFVSLNHLLAFITSEACRKQINEKHL